ncbi:ribonuclease M5 [Isobaculum melis]|uniref:Ribonuclease M5 n=1 Tax=Isobaculum melis TaxID=142588 RepID=A0A1H9SPF3_9LACT|nr:ribonuclease M5 [Isobaculum melis]SER86892.1 RNAse M5 [Isobaculum melis]
MKKIKEIIVVEGKDDTRQVKLAVEADTIETRGSAINEEILEKIQIAQETRGVIVFTDPDFSGEKIRKIIAKEVPGVKHAFITVAEGVPDKKGSLGIEHAATEVIQQALLKAYPAYIETKQLIADELLLAAGLIGGANAKKRRERLGEILRIGYTNGKQLSKRLEMFQITEDHFIQGMRQVLEEENDG